MNELIPNTGNYKKLLTYQKTDVIYQITYYFCHNYLSSIDRTKDQMIQAARSGKQNIIEGCAASSTSSKTEIKLINVAKASLKELLEDYEDYLKTRNHQQWLSGSIEYETMRKLGKDHNDAEYFMNLVSTTPTTIRRLPQKRMLFRKNVQPPPQKQRLLTPHSTTFLKLYLIFFHPYPTLSFKSLKPQISLMSLKTLRLYYCFRANRQ